MSTKFTNDSIPSLTGRVALVTGGNGGIGFTSVVQLALHGAGKVYLAARNPSKASEAVEKIREKHGEQTAARVEVLQCDLADLDSVRKAAEQVLAKESRLDILLNNAGVMAIPYGLTKQGIELQNGTNVVGHALLTYMLLPLLVRTSRLAEYSRSNSTVRIVNVTSIGHNAGSGSHRWTDLSAVNAHHGFEAYGKWARYAHSKTGNIYLSDQLARDTAGERVTSISVHPGVIGSGLYDSYATSWGTVGKKVFGVALKRMTSVEDGALTQLFAATSPEVDADAKGTEGGKGINKERTYNGAYLVPVAQMGKKASHAVDADGARAREMFTFVNNFCKGHFGDLDLEQVRAKALQKDNAAAEA